MAEDLEDFTEIYDSLPIGMRNHIDSIVSNFSVPKERFATIYRQYEYNLNQENLQDSKLPFEQIVLNEIEQKLLNEKSAPQQKTSFRASTASAKTAAAPAKKHSMIAAGNKDIFTLLAQYKRENAKPEAQPANSKAGKFQANQGSKIVPTYGDRPNRGQVRGVYNEGVNSIPGAYNLEGKIEFARVDPNENKHFGCGDQENYDLMNCTANIRTKVLQEQFDVIEAIFKKQLKTEQFEEFYSPSQTTQRICGRVINISTEDNKMKEGIIGLFNANYDMQCRLRLNLQEVPQFSLFEGEVIVAEGFMDTKKFNVNRIWKPEINRGEAEKFTIGELKRFSQVQANKAIQVLVACGPYTVKNELSYEALKDLVGIVNRDKPHLLILAGPFVSHQNEDVATGDIRYKDSFTNELRFLEYQELFEQIMNYVYMNMENKKQTQVVIQPGVADMTHFFPFPQPAFPDEDFLSTKFRHHNQMPHLVPNPSMFKINDVTVGFMNGDVVKDICQSMCSKPTASQAAAQAQLAGGNKPAIQPRQKIDLALQGILQQRTMYPVYPGNVNFPVEWEQYRGMMFDQSPDILITPSNLAFTAKNIDGTVCVNPRFLINETTGGSYASITIDPFTPPAGFDLLDESKKLPNKASDRIRVEIKNI